LVVRHYGTLNIAAFIIVREKICSYLGCKWYHVIYTFFDPRLFVLRCTMYGFSVFGFLKLECLMRPQVGPSVFSLYFQCVIMDWYIDEPYSPPVFYLLSPQHSALIFISLQSSAFVLRSSIHEPRLFPCFLSADGL
jgi:hypothetical protein